MLIYEVLKFRDFSKLLWLLFPTPQKLLRDPTKTPPRPHKISSETPQKLLRDPLWGRDPPVGNHCTRLFPTVREIDKLNFSVTFNHRCRSRQISGGAKSFCPNFPKIARKRYKEIDLPKKRLCCNLSVGVALNV